MLRLHQASLDHDCGVGYEFDPFRGDARSDRIPRLTSGSIGGRISLFALTQGAAASVISVVEAMRIRGASAFAVVFAAGFGAAFGAVMGIVIGTAVAALGKGPRLGRVAFGLYAFAGALVLSDEMGIISALWGRARLLAALSLLATLLGVAALVALLFGLVRGDERGWLERADPRFSSSALFVLGVLALLSGRAVVPEYYRALQNAAACAGSVLCGMGLQCAVARREIPRWFVAVASGAGALLVVLPAFLLDGSRDADRPVLDELPLSRLGLSLETFLTDVDRDGYTSLFAGGDCAPWNARVSPGAKEIPGNGLDDNCLFGDAKAPLREQREPVRPGVSLRPSPVSVVLLTIDTVRRDHVGLYGARPSPTPGLDAFASTARIFDRAYTASTRTCSSVAALQYGLYPLELRWARVSESGAVDRLRRRVPDAVLTPRWMCVVEESGPHGAMPLASYLKARGMATAAVVDDSYTYLLQRELFGEGFDSFEDTPRHTDAEVIPAAVDALHRLEAGAQPFFLWVHLFGAHERERSVKRRDTRSEYDADLARTDAALGPLFGVLDERARRFPLAIVVASDHGELFGPNGRWHGTDLSEELLRIPLFVRAPGLLPGRSDRLVSTVDIMPTVLALTETQRPSRDFVNLAAPEANGGQRILFSDTWLLDLGIARSAAYDGEQKLTYHHRLRTYEFAPQAGSSVADRGRALRVALDGYLAANETNFSEYFGQLGSSGSRGP